jgi:hypothetical protein
MAGIPIIGAVNNAKNRSILSDNKDYPIFGYTNDDDLPVQFERALSNCSANR